MPFLTKTSERQRILAKMRARLTYPNTGAEQPSADAIARAWRLLHEDRRSRRLIIRPLDPNGRDAA